jgi:hypothetical protein
MVWQVMEIVLFKRLDNAACRTFDSELDFNILMT